MTAGVEGNSLKREGRRAGRGPSLTLLSVWSRLPSASVGATRRRVAPEKYDHRDDFKLAAQRSDGRGSTQTGRL